MRAYLVFAALVALLGVAGWALVVRPRSLDAAPRATAPSAPVR